MRQCNCDNPSVHVGAAGDDVNYIVQCVFCGATTDQFETRQDAVDAWDAEDVYCEQREPSEYDSDRLDDIDRAYYDETGELPMTIVTDGVHCVGISVYTSAYVEWLKEQI